MHGSRASSQAPSHLMGIGYQTPSQIHIIRKLLEGRLHPLIQAVDEDV